MCLLLQRGEVYESTAKWIVSNQVFPSFSLPNDEEAWIAPSTNWKPKSANTPSERLMKMGFCNRELNSLTAGYSIMAIYSW